MLSGFVPRHCTVSAFHMSVIENLAQRCVDATLQVNRTMPGIQQVKNILLFPLKYCIDRS